MRSPRMKCPICSEEVRPHERHCTGCQTDCGFPNVRAAEQDDEVKALASRVADAERHADDEGTASLLSRLRAVARRSRAVRVRSLDEAYALVKSDDKLMGTISGAPDFSGRPPPRWKLRASLWAAKD